jgi:hypothetical protein
MPLGDGSLDRDLLDQNVVPLDQARRCGHFTGGLYSFAVADRWGSSARRNLRGPPSLMPGSERLKLGNEVGIQSVSDEVAEDGAFIVGSVLALL